MRDSAHFFDGFFRQREKNGSLVSLASQEKGIRFLSFLLFSSSARPLSMSSDDEELAALRAARVARGGGLTVVRAREREKQRGDVFSLDFACGQKKASTPTPSLTHSLTTLSPRRKPL